MSPRPMRAYMVFTGSGPILMLSTYPKLTDERLVSKLRYKGIDKFIAYEVDLDAVRDRYARLLRQRRPRPRRGGGHAGPRLQRPPDHGQLLPRLPGRPIKFG